MLETLNQIDTQLFLFLNGLHASFIDPLMLFASGKLSWIPLYIFLIYLIFRQYRWNSILILLMVALLITLSDQISVKAFKNVFERPRPCHEPSLEQLIYLPSGECGGAFGFVSSHAANSFAMAVFVFFILRKQFQWIGYLLFSYAALVSYSRIYLGVHYPGDVVVGAMVGVFSGWIIYQFWIFSRKYLCRDNC